MKKNTLDTKQKTPYIGEIPNTPLAFMWYTVKPFKWWLILGVTFNVLTQLLNTYVAIFIGNLTDAVRTYTTPELFFPLTIWFVVLMVMTFFSFRLGSFVAIHFVLKQHKYAHKVIKKYLLEHSHTFYINRFAGTLAGKVFHAGDRSGEMLLMVNFGFTRLIVSLTATGFVMAFFSLWMALAYTLIIAVTVAINLYLVSRRRPHIVAYARITSKYRGQMTDVVSNIQAVRQFSAIGNEYGYLSNILEDRVVKDRRQWTMGEWNHVVNNIMTLILMVSMIGGTYWLLVEGSVTIGAMVTVMILMYRISGIMVDLGDWMNRIIRVYGEVEEGLEEIFIDHEITDTPNAKPMTAHDGEITWSDVTFTYGQNKVFDHFGLTITSGQRVGLVGPSGAGKTTFVSLLLRQHDLDDGAILIDNQDISQVTQDSLREAIAVVPQEPMLFHRTIRENIAYGKPDATDEEIIAVAKKAQAHDFIASLEDGYETLVGERGVKLSGGQKQRVAIARAMLKDAPILVLDEATSALDSESEVLIQKALHELMEEKTVIAVAHRLSTLREMDRILVLEGGQIIEDGNHTELSKAGGTYERLWEHQAGGFVGE